MAIIQIIREELKSLDLSPKALRRFGFLIGSILCLVAAWLWYRERPAWAYVLVPGLVLVTLGVMAPRWLRRVYLAWMTLAFCLGFVVSKVLLTFFFFLVVTPIGWVARWCGNDFLRLRLDRSADSYWIQRKPREGSPKERLRNQY